MQQCLFIENDDGVMYYVPYERIQTGELTLHIARFTRPGAPEKPVTEFIRNKYKKETPLRRIAVLWTYGVLLVPELLLAIKAFDWVHYKLGNLYARRFK